MNTILLQPTDVLFFRDGRPMTGFLAGHGAAWPLPNVTDAAFHAALHRSGLNGHPHDQRNHAERTGKANRQFGSLVTAGPFPVRVGSAPAPAATSGTPPEAHWFFPRPLDLLDGTLVPALVPTAQFNPAVSSLPKPLQRAVANRLPPSKESRAKAWLSAAAYQRYLDEGSGNLSESEALEDSAFCDAEATIGIAIDPATGTTGQGEATGKIYSARYLRLREGWRLGVFAKTDEKNGEGPRVDRIPQLITEHHKLLAGGQQRLCTAELRTGLPLPLPRGKSDDFCQHDGKWLVKWVLLSPAIWPEIPDWNPNGTPITDRHGNPIERHCGGWLPNWVRQSDGQVMLRAGQRQPRSYAGKHTRGFASNSTAIAARLVAAIVPKPIVVTGWALPNAADPERDPGGGAKSTHLAVPAGAVYYFEAEMDANGGPGNAIALAAALNWHGAPNSDPRSPISDLRSSISEIRLNRRSTLMGEKGFGLGVCGAWGAHPGSTRT